ncbi:putative beta-tubulin polyglutamylase [Cucumis melo var. makuwa]|uniref:Putative beta-tubulin polyglutamylase n=1 Tax=Cucumis melo var. makuwa TaxID=1194695 RepID=A0A5D3E397_CUCMM|nr:putative beta-tubulin polyglutamylase [Cucumis melo var. makuwa]
MQTKILSSFRHGFPYLVKERVPSPKRNKIPANITYAEGIEEILYGDRSGVPEPFIDYVEGIDQFSSLDRSGVPESLMKAEAEIPRTALRSSKRRKALNEAYNIILLCYEDVDGIDQFSSLDRSRVPESLMKAEAKIPRTALRSSKRRKALKDEAISGLIFVYLTVEDEVITWYTIRRKTLKDEETTTRSHREV